MFSIFTKNYFLRDCLDNFVDIHNHLLPGIDDGCKTAEESLRLIKRLEDMGITDFINTPHTMAEYYPNTPETISNAASKLSSALKSSHLDHISLRYSSEYMLDNNFEKLLAEEDLIPLKENYLLIEISYFQPPVNFEDLLYKINLAGYQPILAHPERYMFFHDRYDYYSKLKSLGCQFQLNMLSLSSQYGKGVTKTALQLLKDGAYDYLGSDIHHERHVTKIETLKIESRAFQTVKSLKARTSQTFEI